MARTTIPGVTTGQIVSSTTFNNLLNNDSDHESRIVVLEGGHVPSGGLIFADNTTQTTGWTPQVATNSQSGTTYTLVLADAGKVIETTSSSATTITIPTNASVAFPVGTIIEINQYGTGQVTIAGASGVTLRNSSSLTTRVQYSTVSIRQRATNEWVVSGDLS